MFRITGFNCENEYAECYTDKSAPYFTYTFESDKTGAVPVAKLTLNGSEQTVELPSAVYGGAPLKPFTRYEAELTAECVGERASRTIIFETGRMDVPWRASWITDGSYKFTERKTSPEPIMLRKKFSFAKRVKTARIYCTALGIYELNLNGEKVGTDFFAPGFTTYKKQLQYQIYDITKQLQTSNTLLCTLSGGWAVGAFVMTRKNRITAPRQAFLAEIRIVYEDGSIETVCTDESWQVTRDGNLRFAEFYDGEIYDATITEQDIKWKAAAVEKVKIKPSMLAGYGSPVRAHETFKPVAVHTADDGEIIYDFGQNMAGVVRFRVNGINGQKLIIRHAEVLTPGGRLNTAFLRSAKCKIEYICRDGIQQYMPGMTYMGFRYAGVKGVNQEDIEIEAVALYSDIRQTGSFECSDNLINRLQSNIVWSAKSNFVDIPTDCPQRDERMGWTGDIAVFAQTACYNFDLSRFLDKWLKDLRSEQTRGGGLPNTIPSHGYGFPATMPKKAVAFWGDACILVPWAMYKAYGDKRVLEENYGTMKKYVKACKFWANIGVGKHRYIWNDIPAMQFGDWVAPDVEKMSGWQSRCKWTGTASLAASSGILSSIAEVLGKEREAEYFKKLNQKVSEAYVSLLTDGNGKLKNEFQTAYVLPLYFDIFPEEQKKKAVDNLVALIEKNGYRIGTGFPGTPYILFALADNGRADVAFKMLLNTECPSWLYEVKAGATTVWERWDGLDKDGVCRIDDDGTSGMISFNHYGFGSVGDFLYRRIAGIEPIAAGYKTFRIAPVVGGGITYVNAGMQTPYGKICADWNISDGVFMLKIKVPFGTECTVQLPDGQSRNVKDGEYFFNCKWGVS